MVLDNLGVLLKGKILSVLFAISVLVVLASGCGGGSSSSTDPGSTKLETSTPAPKGDVDSFTWALPYGEPTTIDPVLGLDYSPSFVSAQMCDTLLRQDDDGKVVANVASFKQPDPKTLVYTVRDGIKFWDGKPLTADDVAYSLQRSGAPSAYTSLFYTKVKSIEKTGPMEVTVKFKTPSVLFNKEMTNFSAMIVEKAFSENAGKKLGTPSGGIMCSGPFEFDKWTPGQSIELTRNENYWNPEFMAHAKRVSIKFTSDSTALAQGLDSGELDGAYEIPPAIIPRLSKSSTGTLHFGPSTQYITLESRGTDVMKNVGLREAILGVIDREGIARGVLNGAGQANYTLLTPETWDPETKNQWEAAYKPFEDAGQMDADQARKLAGEGGYKGEPVTIGVLAGDETQNQMAQIIQQEAKGAGINVEIKTLQPTRYSEALVDGKADAGDLIFTVGWNSVPDPLEPIPFFVDPKSVYNYTGYNDPELLKLVSDADGTQNAKARTDLLVKAQKIYEAQHLFNSIIAKHEVSFLNNRLTGLPTGLNYLFEPSLAKIGSAE